MAKKIRFQPTRIDGPMQINSKQEACLLNLADEDGNVVELAMTVDFGAEMVAATRSAFMALDLRKFEEGTTPEQRREFGSRAAHVAMRLTAKLDRPRLGQQPDVLVTAAPASTYEQSFSLPLAWAEELMAELQTAIHQARQNQG